MVSKKVVLRSVSRTTLQLAFFSTGTAGSALGHPLSNSSEGMNEGRIFLNISCELYQDLLWYVREERKVLPGE